MRVILLKDVPNVGKKYDVKNVASGHAAHFLFPKGLAEPVTKKRLERVKELQSEREEKGRIQKDLLEKNFESLNNVSITIQAKANEQGHLFQGIHREDIIAALKKQAHVDLPEEFISLEHPIKEVGEHKVEVSSEGKTASFALLVETEKE